MQDINKGMKSMESHQIVLKTKLKEAEEKNSKLEGHMIPKLKDTTNRQKEIAAELERIHLDA